MRKSHPDRCLECSAPNHIRRQAIDSRTVKRAYIDQVKAASQCHVCGYNRHPQALDFHHIDYRKKSFSVSKYKPGWITITHIEAEMAKCVVLCANCHRVFHAKYGQQATAENFMEFLKMNIDLRMQDGIEELDDSTYVTVNGREYTLSPTNEKCHNCGERGLCVDMIESVAPDCEFTYCPGCSWFALSGHANLNGDISIALPE